MKNDGINLAIVGATGRVGMELLNILAEGDIKLKNLILLASSKSKGKSLSCGDKTFKVEDLAEFDFSTADIAIFATDNSISAHYAAIAAENGCIVIDNSSHFRLDEDIPLVVPEINPHDIKHYTRRNIISNPNCSTIQLLLALNPLHQNFPIKKVVVSTYQSVSGAGKSAMDELYNQTKAKYMMDNVPANNFSRQIAFNVIPHIDDFMEDGYTKEEWKMRLETKKIMDPNIIIDATCVRVPVFIGHAESVNIEFHDNISLSEAKATLKSAPGIFLTKPSNHSSYVTPIESVGEDIVFISRLRQDNNLKNTLTMWIVSDNLRKGAALNALQITKYLIQHYLR